MRSASRTLPSGPRPNAFQREVLNGLSHVTCATSPLEDFTIIWTSSSRRFAVLTRLGESSVESSPAGARRRSLGLEQLRRECRKIIAPVQPRVSAFALEKDRLESVLLQELHRAPRRRDQTVVFAGAEPEEVEPSFVGGIIERRQILFLPRFSERCVVGRRRRAAPAADD